MIIVMHDNATEPQLAAVLQKMSAMHLESIVTKETNCVVIEAIGNLNPSSLSEFEQLAGVKQALTKIDPYKTVARKGHCGTTVINIGNEKLGGQALQIIAGPCSVESMDQMRRAAQVIAEAGCKLMRGGAFKPRSSPYTFQGLGVKGLEFLKASAQIYNLPVVTELMDIRMIDHFLALNIDVIQIGARNMQNFALLKEVGCLNKPVILKRGFCATISEWLMAAEYIAIGGNHNIIFCERGIRTFETAYRNLLDISAIPVLKRETHLPVIVDPSHAGGQSWMVPALAKAAIAAGADGLLVEVHPKPEEAWCDAEQALNPEELKKLMDILKKIAPAVDRSWG